MSNAAAPKAPGREGLYFAVWRWHFYAGIVVIPFVIFLATTGSIYLFRNEIEQVLYPELLEVSVDSGSPTRRASPDEQVASALSRHPGATAAVFRPSRNATESSQVDLRTAEGTTLIVYVNPYSADVLGHLNADSRFTQVVKLLHGRLMSGNTGKIIVEIVASWAFVLLVTGLYLWWPRPSYSVWGTLLPRIRQGGRIFWRDLHSVPAFYLTFFTLFLIVTGLPWAFIGSRQIKLLDRVTAGPSGSEMHQSKPPDHREHEAQDWLEQQPVVTHADHVSDHSAHVQPMSLASLIPVAERSGIRPAYEIRLPQSADDVYTISARSDFPADKALVSVDQYSGNIVADVRWQDFSLVSRSVAVGVAVHEGRYFGWPNKLLGLITCLGLIGTAVTGAVMWWQRRPEGRLGAPRVPKDFALVRGVLAITVIFGIVLPLVGGSLILVLVLDRFVISRFPRLRAVLG